MWRSERSEYTDQGRGALFATLGAKSSDPPLLRDHPHGDHHHHRRQRQHRRHHPRRAMPVRMMTAVLTLTAVMMMITVRVISYLVICVF
ncbi:unnamed protein product [Heligmosomoides polygyrus]|uniref:Uncharacterized protein n=1 Tax=Heligmosomoides polygyrus TaxID=6339 RepID=A0A183FI13_HELPZ|nr:unnamed protein product [Heligmosomoides polygyrus]